MINVNKLKRNKTVILVLLPVIICIFVVGWLMYWVGEPRGTQKSKSKMITEILLMERKQE